MLLFVYEFLCGGGLAGVSVSASLQREGWTMLDAVLRDLGRCHGVHTVTLLDADGPQSSPDWANHFTVRVDAGKEKETFFDCARRADFTLVIAPEFDDLLYERCVWVKEAGGRLLGPEPEAIRLTGDKWELADHLRRRGVPTPPACSWRSHNGMEPLSIPFPLVGKPRFGAGSQATFLLRNADDVTAALRQMKVESWGGEMIVQPHCEGFAASVAFLIGRDKRIALPAVAQHLSTDGRFRYLGGVLPLPLDLNARVQRLGSQAIEAVDGLFGYVGVDVVLGSASGDDRVIEINPRLTTSYAGLRRLARFNLAEVLLAVTTGKPLHHLAWEDGPVRFRADGTIETTRGQ